MECSHWWRIEEPAGPVAPARCQICGAEREFETAAVKFSFWEDGASSDRGWDPQPAPVATRLARNGLTGLGAQRGIGTEQRR